MDLEENAFKSNPMHEDQFGFPKGKSTEHAFPATVKVIEKDFHKKEFVVVTLLNIKGAFDNIKPSAALPSKSGSTEKLQKNTTKPIALLYCGTRRWSRGDTSLYAFVVISQAHHFPLLIQTNHYTKLHSLDHIASIPKSPFKHISIIC
jgi:hypothetical protein